MEYKFNKVAIELLEHNLTNKSELTEFRDRFDNFVGKDDCVGAAQVLADMKNKNLDVVKMINEPGWKFMNFKTPLEIIKPIILYKHSVEMLDFLITNGAKVNVEDNSHRGIHRDNIFFYAYHSAKHMKYLVEKEIYKKVQFTDDYPGLLTGLIAYKNENKYFDEKTNIHLDSIAVLLDKHEFLVHSKSDRNNTYTPFMFAISRRQVGVCELLLNRGADIHEPIFNSSNFDFNGQMVAEYALTMAIKEKNKDIQDLIINAAHTVKDFYNLEKQISYAALPQNESNYAYTKIVALRERLQLKEQLSVDSKENLIAPEIEIRKQTLKI